MRTILALSVMALAGSTASAQFPGGWGGGWGGGGFGGGWGGNSPLYGGGLYGGGLSPFLNLRGRGAAFNSAAINYFNFVRPYTGGSFGNAILNAPIMGSPGPRTQFFPNQIPVYADEAAGTQQQRGKPDEDGLIPVDMPPAGYGGGFNNTMGYFGQMNASLGRPQPMRRR